MAPTTWAGRPLDRLSVDRDDGVLTAVMDGGPRGVLDDDLVADLVALVRRVERDPGVRAVVLTGAHPSRFIGHADIAMLAQGGAGTPALGATAAAAVTRAAAAIARSERLTRWSSGTALSGAVRLHRFHDALLRMNAGGAVYVAALNGSALGGGAELAWACDLRVMADGDGHVIGQPEVLLGINPGGGGTQRLTHLVGSHRSLRLLLDGGCWDAAEALRVGAADDVVAPQQVLARAQWWARRLGSRPRMAVAAIKRSVYLGASCALRDGLHRERVEFLRALCSDRTQAIMGAYIERTADAGDLPLYDPPTYREAIERGALPDGAVGQR